MCTVSWCFHEAGYELLFNRDERKTRRRAALPAHRQQHGVRFIAPVDPQGGGTWISANQFGTSLCLLNRYDDQAQPCPEITASRGRLVMALAHFREPQAVIDALIETRLAAYHPFDLLTLSLKRHIYLISWDGMSLKVITNPSPPLCSSAYRTAAVTASRRQLYPACNTTAQLSRALRAYHRSHQPERGPFSVCMHREEAQTVSFSHLRVGPKHLLFAYLDGAPCQRTTLQTSQLTIESQPHKQPQ